MYQDYFSNKLDCSLNDIALEVAKLLSMEAKELFKNSTLHAKEKTFFD